MSPDLQRPDAWLGLDLGTQGARAAVIDHDGSTLGSADVGYRRVQPHFDRRHGVIHEQDPQAWWLAAASASRQALAQAGGPALGAVAIASTSGTLVVQDRDGSAAGAALMYDDARAGAQLARAIEDGDGLWTRLGYRPQQTWALPRLMWLLEHGRVPAGSRIVHQADYVAARLTGHPVATDSSHAFKTGVDPVALEWPGELAALHVDAGLLAPVVAPGTVTGTVGRAGAAASTIAAGTPVRAGMTDGCAAQIAAGALSAGTWTSALGTTLTIKGTSPRPLVDPLGALYNHRHPDPGAGWLPGGASNAGAGVLAELTASELAALTRGAGGFDPAPGVTYPLRASGERFPFVAAAATGFTTLDPAAGADARFAGVLQGVAYVERLCYQRIASLGGQFAGPVVVTGASASNAYWCQLRSDVLHRAVVVPESPDAARGMAILALSGRGSVTAESTRLTRHAARFEPDHARGQRHLDNYATLVGELVARGWLPAAGVGPDTTVEVAVGV